jgi:hypothetical protein
MERRIRRTKVSGGNEATTFGPHDLAKRFAEVQALRELVKTREQQLGQQTPIKKEDGSLRPPRS